MKKSDKANYAIIGVVIVITVLLIVFFGKPTFQKTGQALRAPLCCLGDVNGDGFRDQNDIGPISAAMFTQVGDPNYNKYADLNDDGRVDPSDIYVFAGIRDQPCPARPPNNCYMDVNCGSNGYIGVNYCLDGDVYQDYESNTCVNIECGYECVNEVTPMLVEDCDYDCENGVCIDDPTGDDPCFNGIKDGDESDVDCGGSCDKCADGMKCLSHFDCASYPQACIMRVCTPVTECAELFPGHNDPYSDRKDVVFVGTGFDTMDRFIEDSRSVVDINSEYSGTSLFDLNVYAGDQDKFNFWYIDIMFTPEDFIYNGDYRACTPSLIRRSECGRSYGALHMYICDWNFRGWAYFDSYSAIPSEGHHSWPWPYTFDHEFQHLFGLLADEYTEANYGDRPMYPNCADDITQAQEWWGDLEGQTYDGLMIGYNYGCSYEGDNIRSTTNSMMRNGNEYRLGLVNERYLENERLGAYTGEPILSPVPAVEVVMDQDLNVVSVRETMVDKIKKDKHKDYKITLEAKGRKFEQYFDKVDKLFTDWEEDGQLVGSYEEIPKEEIVVEIPVGREKIKKVKLEIKDKKDKKIKEADVDVE